MSNRIDIIELTSRSGDNQRRIALAEVARSLEGLRMGADEVLMLAALESGAAAQLTQLVSSAQVQTEQLVNAMFTR